MLFTSTSVCANVSGSRVRGTGGSTRTASLASSEVREMVPLLVGHGRPADLELDIDASLTHDQHGLDDRLESLRGRGAAERERAQAAARRLRAILARELRHVDAVPDRDELLDGSGNERASTLTTLVEQPLGEPQQPTRASG